jgi:hypothetical protein
MALNLEAILPMWIAWTIAISGMTLVSVGTLNLWRRYYPNTSRRYLILIAATLAATFAVTWHSHFYMLMLLIPLLLALDLKMKISPLWRWGWIAGPTLILAIVYLLNPDQARNWFGLSMLVLNLYLLFWARRAMRVTL